MVSGRGWLWVTTADNNSSYLQYPGQKLHYTRQLIYLLTLALLAAPKYQPLEMSFGEP